MRILSVWSGETLRLRLPNYITPFDERAIDCAAYTLRLGGEIYVSPSELKDRKRATIRQLQPGEDTTIPPGQFAFLISAETVKVPHDALALISIKARIKWRGLVNVSGFHVDPGYDGKLIFAVYNAGPSTIHLRSGDECFLIWYLSLDQLSESIRHEPGHTHIGSDLVGQISGEWKSFDMIASRMQKIEKAQAAINVTQKVLVALVIGLVVGFALYFVKPERDGRVPGASSLPTSTLAPANIGAPKRPKP